MTRWRLRDYLVVAGLVLSALLVVVPIAATYAGLADIDVQTGLLTVALAACVGFVALDSIPGRWF
jgi:MFS superfamily sulfate permease-like transporter